MCGPYVCSFPAAHDHIPGTRWKCPGCGTTYRLTRPKRAWPWRNWAAPHGHWLLAPLTRRELRARARAALADTPWVVPGMGWMGWRR